MAPSHRAIAFVLVTCAGILAGCQSPPAVELPPAPAEGQSIRASLDWLPLKTHVVPIVYTEGDRKGRRKDIVISPVGLDLWKEVEPGHHVSYLRHNGPHLVVTRDEEIGDNVAVLYDPPLVMLSSELVQGKPLELETRMTVLNLTTGANRDQGQCRYTLELLGRQSFDTPAGRFDAYVVRSTRRISLSLAKVDVALTFGYVPNVGVVYSRIEQTTKVFGVIGGTKVDESRMTR